MTEKLGERLRKLRLSKGTSQEKTATVFGVPKQSWSNWEVGVSNPKLDMIVKLAAYFNVTTDYLLGVEREETGKARTAFHTESKEAVELFVKVDKCK